MPQATKTTRLSVKGAIAVLGIAALTSLGAVPAYAADGVDCEATPELCGEITGNVGVTTGNSGGSALATVTVSDTDWNVVATAETLEDGSGDYSVIVPEGQYYVSFAPKAADGYLPSYYGSFFKGGADPVEVDAEGTTEGIDGVMPKGGTLNIGVSGADKVRYMLYRYDFETEGLAEVPTDGVEWRELPASGSAALTLPFGEYSAVFFVESATGGMSAIKPYGHDDITQVTSLDDFNTVALDGGATASMFDSFVKLDKVKVAPGEKVTATALGLAPIADDNETIDVWLNSDPVKLGTVNIAENFTASGTFTIPANTPAGAHQIVFQVGDERIVFANLEVVVPAAAGTGGSNQLAATGSDLGAFGATGLAIMLLGAGALVVARRRANA